MSGGTGTGKTTLLAALLSLVPPAERLVLVEDSAELRPAHPHVVALEARPPNVEGAGEITLRDLVRQALRMRPDRLVVGEVRGAEVVDLLAALNTGHEGGCSTLHANSSADVPARLEALGVTAGLSREAVHAQVAAALHVVVHLVRAAEGPAGGRDRGAGGRPGRCVRSTPALLPDWWRDPAGPAADVLDELLPPGRRVRAVLASALAAFASRCRSRPLRGRCCAGRPARHPAAAAGRRWAAAVWRCRCGLLGARSWSPVSVRSPRPCRWAPLRWSVSAVVVLLRRSRAAPGPAPGGVIEACDALAAGLRAGQPPHRVLDRVSADVDLRAGRRRGTARRRRAGSAARPRGSMVRRATDRGGVDRRRALGGWPRRGGVAHRRDGAREAEQRRQVDVALGTARSTARLLAGLPLLGVALGSGIEAHPLDVLFGSPVGAWCLLLGTALAAAGLLWVERLADGAMR